MAVAVRLPDSHAAAGDPDTLLASGISSGDLSLTVTTLPPALSGWTDGQFAILIRDVGGGNEEWVLIDSIGGGGDLVWAVAERGYAGSTAAAHLANDEIFFVALEEDVVRIVDGRDISPATVKIDGELGHTTGGVLTPAQLTANTDNLDLDGASVVRLSTDASRNLTGIVAPSPEYARRLIVENIGSFNIVLKDDATSTAANRFQLTADVTLQPMQHVELLYDVTLDRWVLIGGIGGSGASAIDDLTDVVITTPASGEVLKYNGTNWVNDTDATGGGSGYDTIILQDQKTQNTAGGTFTSGADQTRTLNTEVVDTGGHCSLSSNQFTLAAGTYEIDASAPAYQCDRHRAWLYNVTDAAITVLGTSELSLSGDAVQTRSVIQGRFVIAGSKAFEIRHRCQSTSATQGFGVESDFAGVEVYCTVLLRKVA